MTAELTTDQMLLALAAAKMECVECRGTGGVRVDLDYGYGFDRSGGCGYCGGEGQFYRWPLRRECPDYCLCRRPIHWQEALRGRGFDEAHIDSVAEVDNLCQGRGWLPLPLLEAAAVGRKDEGFKGWLAGKGWQSVQNIQQFIELCCTDEITLRAFYQYAKETHAS